MEPTGLLGELMITTAVFSLMAASIAGTSIWKSSARAGTSISSPPASCVHVLYSMKYGETVMTCSPGQTSALKVMAMAEDAPDVRYRFSPV